MLALITGRGALPAAVAEVQEARPLVCALEGHDPDGLVPDRTFRIETLGSLVADLTARGVTTICLCGAITRPAIDPSRIDAETMPHVPVLAGAVAGGEDSALRAVLGIFEDAGLAVKGAHELAPDLLPQPGVLTAARPGDGVERDLAAARAALAEQGRADLGQACVVRAGQVIAREDAGGTDAMLQGLQPPAPVIATDPVAAMLDSAAATLTGQQDAAGAILFKAPKPGQDRRVDLPTIGPETARGAVAAGLAGIAIEAAGVMVLEQAEVIRILDAAGLFLWVL